MNLLIVEDDSIQLDGLKSALEKAYPHETIFTASDYSSAISIINACGIDLFLLDINLDNGRSGLDICEYIRSYSTYKDSPIIFITDIASPSLDVINRYHCSFYFSKPYNVDEVIAAVNSIFCPPRICCFVCAA